MLINFLLLISSVTADYRLSCCNPNEFLQKSSSSPVPFCVSNVVISQKPIFNQQDNFWGFMYNPFGCTVTNGKRIPLLTYISNKKYCKAGYKKQWDGRKFTGKCQKIPPYGCVCPLAGPNINKCIKAQNNCNCQPDSCKVINNYYHCPPGYSNGNNKASPICKWVGKPLDCHLMHGRLAMCNDLDCGVNTYNKDIDVGKNRYKNPCGSVDIIYAIGGKKCPREYIYTDVRSIRDKTSMFKNMCLPKWWYGN